MDLIKIAEHAFVEKKNHPDFKSGDTVVVHYKIKEGNKERIQNFRGVVIQRKGTGATETFTVRNLQVVNLLPETNEIWIKGAIPGGKTALVQIQVLKSGKFDGLLSSAPVVSQPESNTK